MARPTLIPMLPVATVATGLTAVVALQLLILEPVLPAAALGAGAMAIILTMLAIWMRRPRLVTSAVAVLLLIYVLVLIGRSASSLASAAAPIVAGAIFLSTQLGWWAIELRTPAHETAPAVWNRAGQIAAGSVGSALCAALIWQGSRIHPGRSFVFLTVGLAAAIGVILLYRYICGRQIRVPVSVSKAAPHKRLMRGHRAISPRPSGLLLRRARHVVRPPDTHSAWQARHTMRAYTFEALALLIVDLGFTLAAIGSNVHPIIVHGVQTASSTINAAPGISFGVLGAAAIIVGWLSVYLRSIVGPLEFTDCRPLGDSPQASTLSELETIRTMCRRAWRSGGTDADLNRFLSSLYKRMGADSSHHSSTAGAAGTTLAQVDAIVVELEALANV